MSIASRLVAEKPGSIALLSLTSASRLIADILISPEKPDTEIRTPAATGVIQQKVQADTRVAPEQ